MAVHISTSPVLYPEEKPFHSISNVNKLVQRGFFLETG